MRFLLLTMHSRVRIGFRFPSFPYPIKLLSVINICCHQRYSWFLTKMDCFTSASKLAICLCVLISFPSVSLGSEHEAHGCNFPAIFNFGDSNSDTGGLSAAFTENPWPNGITFFREFHRRSGRATDGRVILDFIAESLGLPFIHAYLDAIRANFSHGVNFATSASTIRNPNVTLAEGYSPFYLNVQLEQFTQFKSRSQMDYNQEGVFEDLLPKEDYFSRALYTFDIGQNDLTLSDFFNMTTQQVTANITAIMNDFATVVKEVYNSGGRYFWIHNTGPIGCLAYVPDYVPENQTDEAGCAIEWNKLAQNFNRRLNETVVRLRKDLPLGVFIYVDVYSVKYALFSQPKKYGFEQPLIVCCGRGGKYNYSRLSRCGTTSVVDGKETVVGACEDPSARVNWDGVHYTEAANKLIFSQIASGAFSDPPIPLKKQCASNKSH